MADAYEEAHMAGDGAVLHRQKAVVPRWLFGLIAGLPLSAGGITTAALLGLGSAASVATLAPLLGAMVLAIVASGLLLTFGVGRVAVSEGALHLQIGTAGPKIPIDDIASFDIGQSGTKKWGLGYRKLRNGTEIYSLMGDNARAVRVRLHGRATPLVIVPRDPDALMEALARAKGATRTGARVELEDPLEEDVESTEPEREMDRKRS